MASRRIAGQVLVALVALVCSACDFIGQQRLPIVARVRTDAAKYDVEFQKYDKMIAVYKARGVQPALIDYGMFWYHDMPEEEIYRELKRFHVVHFTSTFEHMKNMSGDTKERARRVSRAMLRYVREGGGLLLALQQVRYPNTDDLKYTNLLMEPFGLQVTREGLFDETHAYDLPNESHEKMSHFWYTGNTSPHPVTKGVKRVYLPSRHGGAWCAAVPLVRYTHPDWQVILRGEKGARTYRISDRENKFELKLAGSVDSAPPVVAVRQIGKGRVVCYPLSWLYTGMNYANPYWHRAVETEGDKAGGHPSDGFKLQFNCYKWLAGPAMKNPALGTYRVPPFQRVQFPASIDWDPYPFSATNYAPNVFRRPDDRGEPLAPVARPARGIVGVHTAYTDGKGTVSEYAEAAKRAGLKFIAITDPLEQLSRDEFEQLKADCAAVNKAGDFFACPGVEFTDGPGIRWAIWSERLCYPVESFRNRSSNRYTQWDGKRVHCYGKYNHDSGFPTCSAVVDYKDLRRRGIHPEKLWWFWQYLPFVYEKDRLVADQLDEFLLGLRDLRWASVFSYTRIRDPEDVALAGKTAFTGFRDLAAARQVMRGRALGYHRSLEGGHFASQGPVVELWQAVNAQMEHHWRYTRGAQRIRFKFVVSSPDGIAEVKVHDASFGVLRRFDGRGAKRVTREFELAQDKQHFLVLEVFDTAGKRAISSFVFTFCYKQGLYRCGDNLNTLGPTGMIWHPDRNQMFPMAKPFYNADEFRLRGVDGSPCLSSIPQASWPGVVRLKGVGDYPDRGKQKAVMGPVMEYTTSNHNVHIATMRMTHLSELHNTAKRPRTAVASVPLDVAENRYVDWTHTIIAPSERRDYYVTWNHRRYHEGLEGYQGGFIWHEGSVRFKKNVTLAGDVPIPLVRLTCPIDTKVAAGQKLMVVDTALGKRTVASGTVRGRIRPGGYAGIGPSGVGYHGVLVPPGMDLAYESQAPGRLTVGMGADGQKVKAGTVMTFRYVVGTFVRPKPLHQTLEHTVKAMNFGGGTDGYPVKLEAGEIVDATFFLTLDAEKGEVVGTLGPQDLMLDLPMRVRGLEDNGCAAVYSSRRPWFRFLGVVEGTAHFQESISEANRLWVGNIFVADEKALKMTVVVDGQAPGKPPFVEVHNPTRKDIVTTLRSPAHTPTFGGMSTTVTVPAGDSIRLWIKDGRFQKRSPQ